ncbi:MAG: GSCFA domain-containing protein [Pseudomonadota bacterium]
MYYTRGERDPEPEIGNLTTLEGGGNGLRTWFRGRAALHAPDQAAMMAPGAVDAHVLHGWAPSAPRIDRTTHVTAFGSCFAAHITRWLAARNYRVSAADAEAQRTYVVRIGEGLVNSFVIRQQFEWAWERRGSAPPRWQADGAALPDDDADIQRRTRALFDRTDVFILTFGLSEVWYDKPTGEVFWRTIPKAAYDPSRHGFRVSTVEENRENIEAIYRLIRRHRPKATIIVTLSPVPLIATFRDTSCITSNTVSKSVLRVALDEALRRHKSAGYLFYWPSYELVTDVFGSPFKADRRHLPRSVLDFIMNQFERTWCSPEAADGLQPLDEAYLQALAASRILPPRLDRAVRKRHIDVLRRHTLPEKLSPDPQLGAAMAALVRGVADRWDRERLAS